MCQIYTFLHKNYPHEWVYKCVYLHVYFSDGVYLYYYCSCLSYDFNLFFSHLSLSSYSLYPPPPPPPQPITTLDNPNTKSTQNQSKIN